MAERFSTLFFVLLLAFLAGLTYWLDKAMETPVAPRESQRSQAPDFTVNKLLATRMDLNGRIRDTLQAARMVHYPEDDRTELERPTFVSLARGTPLSISSNRATVSSNGGNLYFHDDVRATRAGQAGGSALVVATDYLHVLLDDNIAKTDRPVTISDANMSFAAAGMELNSETRVLKLYGRVTGVYGDPTTLEIENRAGNQKK